MGVFSDPNTTMGKTIFTLVEEGLMYLDTRTDFWRQQKPMYARRHEKIMQKHRFDSNTGKLAPNDYIIKELERIDQGEMFVVIGNNMSRTFLSA